MHLSPLELKHYKSQLISEYVWPAFGGLVSLDKNKFDDVARHCHIQRAVKYQRLESPGNFASGAVWFSIGSMCHSYFYNYEKQRESGTSIYKKRQFIFNGDSLLHAQNRLDYIQILETSDVLSISYSDVLELMDRYSDIRESIRLLSAQQGFYFRNRSSLLNLPSLERVRTFRNENPLFLQCASQEIQAMHVNLSLRHYNKIINELL